MERIGVITVADSASRAIAANTSTNHFLITAPSAVTLTSPWAVTTSATLYKGLHYQFDYSAPVTLSGGSVVILSTTIPAHLVAKKLSISATYSGTAWIVMITPSLDETALLIASHLASTFKIGADKIYNAALTTPVTLTGEQMNTLVSHATVSSDILALAAAVSNILEVAGKHTDLGTLATNVTNITTLLGLGIVSADVVMAKLLVSKGITGTHLDKVKALP